MIKIFSKKSNVVTEDILEALASVFRNIFCADLVFNYFPFLFIYLVYWCFGEQCFRISVIQFPPLQSPNGLGWWEQRHQPGRGVPSASAYHG